MPVETLKIKDSAVLGAAIFGGPGFGLFKDISLDAVQMVKTDIKVDPRNAKMQNEHYQQVKKIILRFFF